MDILIFSHIEISVGSVKFMENLFKIRSNNKKNLFKYNPYSFLSLSRGANKIMRRMAYLGTYKLFCLKISSNDSELFIAI